MASRLDRDHPAIAQLASAKADKLVVECADGEKREISVPKAGNRWKRVAKLLDGLPWECIEGYAGDKLVARIQSDEGPGGDDDDDDGYEGPADIARISAVLVRQQRETMRECREMFRAQLDGQATLLDSMGTALRQVGEAYNMAMRLQAAQAVQEAHESGDGEMANMLRTAFQLYAMKQALPASPPPPPPPPPPTSGKGGG